MSKRMLWSLWGLAGMVALLLTAVTMELTAVAEENTTEIDRPEFVVGEEVVIQEGMPVYLTGEEIWTRVAPDPSADVITSLQPGTRVVILAVQEAFGQPWYLVEAARGRNGWIPHENVTINRPSSAQ